MHIASTRCQKNGGRKWRARCLSFFRIGRSFSHYHVRGRGDKEAVGFGSGFAPIGVGGNQENVVCAKSKAAPGVVGIGEKTTEDGLGWIFVGYLRGKQGADWNRLPVVCASRPVLRSLLCCARVLEASQLRRPSHFPKGLFANPRHR